MIRLFSTVFTFFFLFANQAVAGESDYRLISADADAFSRSSVLAILKLGKARYKQVFAIKKGLVTVPSVSQKGDMVSVEAGSASDLFETVDDFFDIPENKERPCGPPDQESVDHVRALAADPFLQMDHRIVLTHGEVRLFRSKVGTFKMEVTASGRDELKESILDFARVLERGELVTPNDERSGGTGTGGGA